MLTPWVLVKKLDYDVEKKVSGNHMTQKYYTERLLPIYIDAIQIQRAYDSSS